MARAWPRAPKQGRAINRPRRAAARTRAVRGRPGGRAAPGSARRLRLCARVGGVPISSASSSDLGSASRSLPLLETCGASGIASPPSGTASTAMARRASQARAAARRARRQAARCRSQARGSTSSRGRRTAARWRAGRWTPRRGAAHAPPPSRALGRAGKAMRSGNARRRTARMPSRGRRTAPAAQRRSGGACRASKAGVVPLACAALADLCADSDFSDTLTSAEAGSACRLTCRNRGLAPCSKPPAGGKLRMTSCTPGGLPAASKTLQSVELVSSSLIGHYEQQ